MSVNMFNIKKIITKDLPLIKRFLWAIFVVVVFLNWHFLNVKENICDFSWFWLKIIFIKTDLMIKENIKLKWSKKKYHFKKFKKTRLFICFTFFLCIFPAHFCCLKVISLPIVSSFRSANPIKYILWYLQLQLSIARRKKIIIY